MLVEIQMSLLLSVNETICCACLQEGTQHAVVVSTWESFDILLSLSHCSHYLLTWSVIFWRDYSEADFNFSVMLILDCWVVGDFLEYTELGRRSRRSTRREYFRSAPTTSIRTFILATCNKSGRLENTRIIRSQAAHSLRSTFPILSICSDQVPQSKPG